MEKLKALVPESVKQAVAESNTQQLPATCSYLLDFLRNLPQFHQMVSELSSGVLCAKNKEEALELKRKANESYLSGDYKTALPIYSQALRIAPMDSMDMGKNLVAAIYLNRASSFHKLSLMIECLRDCSRALQILPCYAKAWYRRGKANADLGNYDDAIHDLNIAKEVELSVDGKRQIESELKKLVDQYGGTSSDVSKTNESNLGNSGEVHPIKLLCVDTPDKGRGIVTPCDIAQSSLIHEEEPYAAIILKSSRENHCHHCFSELPADTVPCLSCSIPLYCSQGCRVRAGGKTFKSNQTKVEIPDYCSKDLKEYVSGVTSLGTHPDVEYFPEHKHECLGMPWPAVLPSDIVLAGRVLARSVSQKRSFMESSLLETEGLSHSYSQINPDGKLELHIYAIVLLSCLQNSDGFQIPVNEVSLSQTVILMSQIKVNCMAIVRMKSVDFGVPLDQIGRHPSATEDLMSSVEQGNMLGNHILSYWSGLETLVPLHFSWFSNIQVQVGQAIYLAGSLFNHSCKPNIHAYFLSRTLCVRTTENVSAGCPLELSYGPQVGQWDRKDRLKILADRYSFQCQCSGCSGLLLSDLVLNAYRCLNPDCNGIVLDSDTFSYGINKLKNFLSSSRAGSSDPLLQVVKFDTKTIDNLTPLSTGCCLNCGCHHDVESSLEAVRKSWNCINRLQDAISSKKIRPAFISEALRALDVQRSVLHEYNKGIAQTLDILAQASCLVGDLHSARAHCKAAIKILEMLYGPEHIVIGYELVKLSTIQLSLGENSILNSVNRLNDIFFRHYGSHTYIIFPYLQSLRFEACEKFHKRLTQPVSPVSK